jgi:hypothetical protein
MTLGHSCDMSVQTVMGPARGFHAASKPTAEPLGAWEQHAGTAIIRNRRADGHNVVHQAVGLYIRLLGCTSGCWVVHQAVGLYIRLLGCTSGCWVVHQAVG